MKVIVTGGTGYIGSHTVVEMQQQGYEVIIIDNLSNSFIDVLLSIEKITGIKPVFENLDLCDADKLDKFFKQYNDIKAVIHFAAFKAVGESVQYPLKYYRNNLISLINLLQHMTKYAVNYLVYSSSCTVYGQPDKLPVNEYTPVIKPLSPYGNTKKISEEIIEDSVKTTSLKAISLRYFNPIGAHASALIGELPIGIPNNLVPFITQTAIGKYDVLNVFGSDYNTPDGTAIRDYIHVADLAKAHIAAIERLINKNNKSDYEVFNLGTGKGNSVLEVINAFIKVTGIKLKYRFAERRKGDIEQIWAETTLANKELKWKAEKNLDDMMLSSWKWEQHIKNSKF